jgi:hypothetical protein
MVTSQTKNSGASKKWTQSPNKSERAGILPCLRGEGNISEGNKMHDCLTRPRYIQQFTNTAFLLKRSAINLMSRKYLTLHSLFHAKKKGSVNTDPFVGASYYTGRFLKLA